MSVIDPRRRYPCCPVVDEETAAVLDEAIHALVMLRSPMCEGDAGAALHALGSLLAQALILLPSLTASARDQELSWPEIAGLLGLNPRELTTQHDHDLKSWGWPIGTD
jgi:hypothetical protein